MGYYQPYNESITVGLSFEPGIMLSASTSIKLNQAQAQTQTAKEVLDEHIATLIEAADLSGAQAANAALQSGVFPTTGTATPIGTALAETHNALRDGLTTTASTDITILVGNNAGRNAGTQILVVLHENSDEIATRTQAFVRALVRRPELTGASEDTSDELLNLAARYDVAKSDANIISDLFGGDEGAIATTPQGVVSFGNSDNDDSPTLFHLTLPIYATAIFHSEKLNAFAGVGTGIMFYDLGDEVNGGAAWPVLGKLGVAIPVTDKIEVSLDGRFHYAITTPSDIDSIWSFGVGAGISYFF
ncbi:hypothetical protein [Candidatus Mycalebacterium sp.]